jgi:hypothetical protein
MLIDLAGNEDLVLWSKTNRNISLAESGHEPSLRQQISASIIGHANRLVVRDRFRLGMSLPCCRLCGTYSVWYWEEGSVRGRIQVLLVCTLLYIWSVAGNFKNKNSRWVSCEFDSWIRSPLFLKVLDWHENPASIRDWREKKNLKKWRFRVNTWTCVVGIYRFRFWNSFCR